MKGDQSRLVFCGSILVARRLEVLRWYSCIQRLGFEEMSIVLPLNSVKCPFWAMSGLSGVKHTDI